MGMHQALLIPALLRKHKVLAFGSCMAALAARKSIGTAATQVIAVAILFYFPSFCEDKPLPVVAAGVVVAAPFYKAYYLESGAVFTATVFGNDSAFWENPVCPFDAITYKHLPKNRGIAAGMGVF